MLENGPNRPGFKWILTKDKCGFDINENKVAPVRFYHFRVPLNLRREKFKCKVVFEYVDRRNTRKSYAKRVMKFVPLLF